MTAEAMRELGVAHYCYIVKPVVLNARSVVQCEIFLGPMPNTLTFSLGPLGAQGVKI